MKSFADIEAAYAAAYKRAEREYEEAAWCQDCRWPHGCSKHLSQVEVWKALLDAPSFSLVRRER